MCLKKYLCLIVEKLINTKNLTGCQELNSLPTSEKKKDSINPNISSENISYADKNVSGS